MSLLVHLIYLAPVVAAIGILLGLPARRTAVIAALIALVSALLIFLGYDRAQAGYQFASSLPLVRGWDLKFFVGVDGLSATLLLLTSIVALAAIWLAPKVDYGENRYYACILLIAAGAAGAFASLDLFFFYAFHELALIPTFLMIGIWGSGNRQNAAWKITIYLSIGSIILLVGLIGLYLLPPAQAANVRYRKTAATRFNRSILGTRIQVCLYPVIDRLRDSGVALPVSHLGAASVCLGAGTGCDAACRRVEEVWTLRPSQSGSAADAGSGAALGSAASDPF